MVATEDSLNNPRLTRFSTLIVTLSILETLIFGGWYFGWTAIVFVAKEEGFYADDCLTNSVSNQSNTTLTCFNQDKQLNAIFTITNASMSVIGILGGFLFHKTGYTKGRSMGL